MPKEMFGKSLTEFDPASKMPSSDALEKLNQPLAREHKAHISGENKLGEHVTPKQNLGALGGRGQAGK